MTRDGQEHRWACELAFSACMRVWSAVLLHCALETRRNCLDTQSSTKVQPSRHGKASTERAETSLPRRFICFRSLGTPIIIIVSSTIVSTASQTAMCPLVPPCRPCLWGVSVSMSARFWDVIVS